MISIITLKDLIAYLEEKPEMAEHWPQYGRIAKRTAYKNCRMALRLSSLRTAGFVGKIGEVAIQQRCYCN